MKSSKWMGAAVAVSLVLGLAAVAAADAEPTGGKAVKAAAGQAAPAAGKEAWAVCPVQKTRILKTKAVDTVVCDTGRCTASPRLPTTSNSAGDRRIV